MRDMAEKGRASRHGGTNRSGPIPDATIREIRARCEAGERHVDIARDLSLHRTAVNRIARNKAYAYVA
jgi:hypothetical protein